MRKYHGTLIHRSRDEHGTLEIVDDIMTRSLHFGNFIRQSAMVHHHPDHLALAYTCAMMSCLRFQPAPARVLLIGLGGGSLAKFLLRHFPECEVHAVEHRAAVAKLAYGYFQLPDVARLHVHIADAGQFIQTAAGEPFDLILLDAYDERGMATGMDEPAFLEACRQRLAPQGLLVANLWGRERARYKHTLANLQRCFGAPPLQLPSEGTTNVITLSARHALSNPGSHALPPPLLRLEERTGLQLGKLARRLHRRNRPWWARLLR
ncbi:MAG: spermine synthase [Pseudomonadota bacterium]